MTLASILTALGSVAAISTAVYGIFRWVTWKFQTTPQGKKEDISRGVEDEEKRTKETGRP